MATIYIFNEVNPSTKALVHTGERKYAVHLGGNHFFAYMDGHYGEVEYEQQPTFTTDISEAIRMLEYAREDLAYDATIVIVSEVVLEEVSGAMLDDHVRQTALAKLTEREKNALGIKQIP
jgi:hypothetical protein